MKYILGTKLDMTQRFRDDGSVVPVTRISAPPCTVTQVRTAEQDGYMAVQIGVGQSRRVAKPQIGHTKKLGRAFARTREFRMSDVDMAEVGKNITVAAFVPGDMVTVVGVSKGRGFQGVVKRHGFRGHPASHGHKDQLRMPGSIGSKRQGPVAPGKRMAGRMGGDQITVHGLEVIAVDTERNELWVKGAVPGARGGAVLVSADGALTFVSTEASDQVVVTEAPTVEVVPAEVPSESVSESSHTETVA